VTQPLFQRIVKLTIAPPIAGTFRTQPTQSAMVISDLRVKFKIVKTLRKEPNHSTVEVYNLNATSRGQLQGKGARVWLEAGYGTTLAQAFVGDVRYIDHRKEGASDWLTKMELGDGERAFVNGRVKASFRRGTTKADILKALAQQSGWELGNISDFYASLGQPALSGFVAWGTANREIDRLLRSQGLTFSVQDGSIQILPLTGYTPAAAVLIDEAHGMIGSPEAGSAPSKGKARILKVKCLLDPDKIKLKPGQRIALQSLAHKGTHVIQKIEFDGDTFADNWYAELEVQA
jgi:hypothetical protein